MPRRQKTAALYLRVSTGEQTTENQRRELIAVAERAGWEVGEVYEDAGISGAKGRNGRPAFNKLCQDATRRQFDVVMAWSVDRLGRSLQDLCAFLNELHAVKVDLYLHQQGVDTTTPAGKALFQMMGVFAEFERSIMRERIMAGLARTTKKSGRPAIDTAKRKQILSLHADELTIRAIAKKTGLGVGTVHRVLSNSP